MKKTNLIIISLMALSIMLALSVSAFADGMSASLVSSAGSLSAGDTFKVDLKLTQEIYGVSFTFDYDHSKLELVKVSSYEDKLDVSVDDPDRFTWYSLLGQASNNPVYATFRIKDAVNAGDTISVGIKDIEATTTEYKTAVPTVNPWKCRILSDDNGCESIKVTVFASEEDRANGNGGFDYFAVFENGNFRINSISYETLYYKVEAIPTDPDAKVKYSSAIGKLNVDGETSVIVTISAPSGASKKYTLTLETQTCAHQYVELEDTYVAPTCSVSGSVKEKCTVCGTEKLTLVDKAPHEYIQTVFVPTCTEGGYTLNVCAVCSDSYRSDETSAVGHSFVVVSTTSTCRVLGESHYKCSACEEECTEKDVVYAPHKYASKVIAATCTESGKTVHTCEICSETYEDAYTNAAGHNYKPLVTESTCTTAGYTTFTCEGCQHKYVDHYTSAIGHKYGEWKTEVAATTEKDGVAKRKCNACTESEVQVLPKLVDGVDGGEENVGSTDWQLVLIIILIVGIVILLILLFVMYFTFKKKSSIRNMNK